MSRRNIDKKTKPFWKDTEAISPVIATILILAVAVAAGVGLYMWFDTFQEGAQAEVGNSTTASMNIMIEESLGDELLKLVLPVTQFNFKSILVDVDNDEKIYKPTSTGNYSYKQEVTGGTLYTNSWYEERFIQEIATTVTNRGPRDLTNVKIKYTELPSSLNYCLHIDRDSDWQLLDVDGTPADMTFTTNGVVEGTSMHYYFGGSKPGINYTDHDVAYADQSTKSWGNNILKVASIYDVDGNHRYAYADNGTTDNGTTYGWNTAGTLFSSNLNSTNYQWCKEHLHNSVYEVGDLKSGETKTVYTYFLAGYFTPKYVEGDSFADCMVNLPIEVYCDQGLRGSVTAKIHMMDLDAGEW